MSGDWRKIIGAVAPGIATALGGPLAGVATQALSAALLGKGDGTEQEISAAILTGGTDALAAIKKADAGLTVRMRELDIDLERVHQADRASARDRQARTGDWTPSVLAAAITVGFFSVLWELMHGAIPETGRDALLVMLGSLGTAWASVVAYYYGSSTGSARKTALLEKVAGR